MQPLPLPRPWYVPPSERAINLRKPISPADLACPTTAPLQASADATPDPLPDDWQS